jgi:sec-independent protein translocase protein TatB
MFGMSFTELVIIGVLALILLGPDKLPDAARTAGKLMRELRRATDDIKDQLETEMYADELKRRQAAVQPVPAARPGAALPAPQPAGDEKPAETVKPIEAEKPDYPGIYGFPAPPAASAPIEPAPAPAKPEEPGQAPKA